MVCVRCKCKACASRGHVGYFLFLRGGLLLRAPARPRDRRNESRPGPVAHFHIRLTEQERDETLTKLNVKLEDLPRILKTDPICRYNAFLEMFENSCFQHG
mmetsp:Transcript_21593/g.63851  ORF Transcript_21593/g.63851 Transcript_21593/m.63851 type:complete len:101 (+) Transcript_21593:354-656(+)